MSDYIVFRCKYYSPDGVCEFYTDDEVTEYCVEGPCLHEEPPKMDGGKDE